MLLARRTQSAAPTRPAPARPPGESVNTSPSHPVNPVENSRPVGDFKSQISNFKSTSAVESEVVTLFVDLARLLGQPRSVAEIYGLLFISPQPLTMDDLITRLGLSKGSASQGLRYLRSLGAVEMLTIDGDRRTHYRAVAALRELATRFLRDQIVPQLDAGLARLETVAKMVKDLPPAQRAHAATRVTMLHSWEKKSRRVLPLVVKVLGG